MKITITESELGFLFDSWVDELFETFPYAASLLDGQPGVKGNVGPLASKYFFELAASMNVGKIEA